MRATTTTTWLRATVAAATVAALLALVPGSSGAQSAGDETEQPNITCADELVIESIQHVHDPRVDDPYGIAADGDGNRFVADSGSDEVLRFDDQGVVDLVIEADDADPELSSPRGIDVFNQLIYVTDAITNTVYVFDQDGKQVFAIPATASTPALDNPIEVAVGEDGRIYVADAGTDLVHVFDDEGGFKALIGGAASPALGDLSGVSVDSSDNVYVTDVTNDAVYRFDDGGNQTLHLAANAPDPDFFTPGWIDAEDDGSFAVSDASRGLYVFDASGDQLGHLANGDSTPPFGGSVQGVVLDGTSLQTVSPVNNRLTEHEVLCPGRVAGTVTEDGSGNPAVGVPVVLQHASLQPASYTTTDANGDYLFDDLLPGSYVVQFAGGPTHVPEYHDDSALGSHDPVTVLAGTTATVDAGLDTAGSISGNVGPQDDVFVAVVLEGRVVQHTVSDASGNYSFPNLTPGEYLLVFLAPDGSFEFYQGAGNPGDADRITITSQAFHAANVAL